MILVTGASSGIGAALALALAGDAPLLLVARRADRLAQVVAQVHERGGEAHALALDLTSDDAPRRVFDAVTGSLRGLVLNAGLFATADVAAMTDAHLDSVLELNLRAPIRLAAALALRLDRGSTVAVVSSHAARTPFPGCAAYAASKAGLEAWAAVARVEWRARGIRVGVIAIGATDTEAWPADTAFDRTRMCRAEDIAQAIRSLLLAPASVAIERVEAMPPAGAL